MNFVLINWGPSLCKPYFYYIITQTKIALIYYCEFSANRLQIEFLYLLIRVNQCHSIQIISVFFYTKHVFVQIFDYFITRSPTLPRNSLSNQTTLTSTNAKTPYTASDYHSSSTNPFELESSMSVGYFSSTNPAQSNLSVHKPLNPFDETSDSVNFNDDEGDGNENVTSHSFSHRSEHHESVDVGFNESLTGEQQRQQNVYKPRSLNPFDWD